MWLVFIIKIDKLKEIKQNIFYRNYFFTHNILKNDDKNIQLVCLC